MAIGHEELEQYYELCVALCPRHECSHVDFLSYVRLLGSLFCSRSKHLAVGFSPSSQDSKCLMCGFNSQVILYYL
jgi:hypothetical protein